MNESKLKQQMAIEMKAFRDPRVFVEEVLGIDWLWPVQEEIVYDFYEGNYQQLISVLGQRCLHPDTKILTTDGTYEAVKDLNKDKIYGMKDGDITKCEFDVWKNNTKKEAVRITTYAGEQITVTKDHEIFTSDGLKEAQNLTVEDHLYRQRETLSNSYTLDQVIKIEDVGEIESYDISVPETENYFAENLLVHNSGKTTAASIIAVYELFKLLAIGRPCSYYDLPKGQDLYIICTASSAQQAKDTIYSQIEARIENCDWFKDYGYTQHAREFIFETDENRIYLRSEHSNSSSLAGHTAKTVILDEMARFKDTGGHTSADMVYDTLSRTLATFGRQGKMIVISSPLLKDDFLMNLYRSGKETDSTLTKHYATWEANPNISMDDLDAEFQRNPEAAWRDFGAQPSSSLEGYFKEQNRIDNAVDENIELCPGEYTPPDIPSIAEPCYIAGDPATKNDAFGIAMAHKDQDTDKVIVDIAHRFEPSSTKAAEVDARKVSDFIVELAENHNVVSFTTDVWSFQRALQRIEQTGIPVEQNHALKEEYDHLKELIYTNQIKLPSTKVVVELKSLEIKNAKKVDHPSKGSKDISDAVCNAVWALEQKQEEAEEPIALVF